MNYWLFKSEPDVFSIDDLQRKGRAPWDGVRNYQARNYLKQCQLKDQVLFYHSSCKQIGISGIAQITGLAHPDPSQFDPESRYFDNKSPISTPRWLQVEVEFVKKFSQIITLDWLKSQLELQNLPVVQKGSRLSVMPVSETEFIHILHKFTI